MSRTVTLSQLRDDVRFQADLIGATVRHTDAQLTRLVNQSIQEFREAICNEGDTRYLVPYSGTLTAGATSPHAFGELDLSAISPSIVRTYKLDVTVDGVVVPLEHRPFRESSEWGGPIATGVPLAWAHYQTAKIAITPAPNAAYSYTLWYLPVLADLSGDSDTFDGVAGWEAWIVWDVVCRLLIRDQQAVAFSTAKTYRDDVWNRIGRNANKVSSAGGAVVGRDTLGRTGGGFFRPRGGPVMAGGGLPGNHSVTLAMLAELAGPAFLGRDDANTGDVERLTPAEAAAILPTFTPAAAGLVPAAGGSSTSLFLTQAGTFQAVSGGGGGAPGGPTGSIQIHGLSGFVGLTGFAVQGSPPSMTVRLPGSLRVTGGTVDVGSGTVRISASGIDGGGGALGGFATLLGFPTFAGAAPGLVPGGDGDSTKFLNAAGGFAVPAGGGSATGVTNSQMADMPSGTVKARLTGTGAPQDVLIPTLFMYAPTMTSSRAGLVGPGGGALTDFLRGDGVFAAPTGFTFTPTGLPNANLAVMPTGTVKANLTGTGAPSDVAMATLFAFIPTFTAGRAGLVPATSDGDPGKFLNALGAFATPPVGGGGGAANLPGGATLSVQYNMGSGIFGGATGIRVVGSGTAFEFGPSPPAAGTLRLSTGQEIVWQHPNGFAMTVIGVAGDGVVNVGSPSGTEFDVHSSSVVDFNIAGVPLVHRWSKDEYRMASGTQIRNDQSVRLDGLASSGTVDLLTNSTLRGQFSASGLQLFQGLNFPTGVPVFGHLSLGSGITNALMAPMGSGTVKANLSGTGAPSDVPFATLMAFAPTFMTARAGLVPARGTSVGFVLKDDASWGTVANSNMDSMNSGTVKANLGPSGDPQDVRFPTLFSFIPTFTTGRVGLVPGTADGDSTKFLNAAGAFSVPAGGVASPGGSVGNLQFNNGAGGFGGASGLNAVASGTALGVGATYAALGDLRGGMSFTAYGLTRSGLDSRIFDWGGTTGAVRFGDSVNGLTRSLSEVGTGGRFEWAIGGVTATTARIIPTGVDFTKFHVAMQGINVASGIPNTQLTPMLSGTVKANLSGLSTPADVNIPTLMAFMPTFTAGRVGLVPGTADGDTGKFLNAAGAFSTPVAAANPGGDSGNVQWNNAGAMAGASGIHAVAGGAALALGPASSAADRGTQRVGSGFALMARNASGTATPLVEWWNPTGTARFGSSGLARQLAEVASGGAFDFVFGGATAATARMLPTGFDFTPFHAAFKSLNAPNINGYPADANQLTRGSITWLASGIRLYVPKGASTGANRWIVPTGALGTNVTITLWPTGARGGNTIRIERLDRSAGNITVATPSGTTLYIMPSGTAEVADFVFTKPSGAAFEYGGSGQLF